ncbi:endonuclease V [Candidatus Woesearchaeota archaeon]|nr:endonuclease V [Candidatus Woesearchaeota archaeon]
MIDIGKLKKEQLKLAEKVTLSDGFKRIKTIGGADQASVGSKIISSIAVCDYKNLEAIEEKHAIADAAIPYISGFLFYKEGPAIIEAFNLLENKPDVLIVKGNGILHPRRIGMASQLGVLLDTATIGVAKNLMLGQVREKTVYVEKEARGYELITREYANPIYISPGNKISLKTSLEVVKKCLRYPHKLPMPLHLAHKNTNKVKKEIADG